MAENTGSSSAGAGGPQIQRTLDRWIEPSLPEPVPSYRDRPNLNIPAFGVLTHMAPLGTLPNSKMQKIAKSDTSSRLKLNNGGASGSAVSTPMEGTMTPDPQLNSSIESNKEEEDMESKAPVTPSAQMPGLAQSIVANGAESSIFAQRTVSQAAPYVLPLSTRPPLSISRTMMSSSNLFTPTTSVRPPVRLEQVVLSAIRSARGAGRHHTAFALTDLITNQRGDPNVDRVLRAVATSGGNIHSTLLAEFSAMVKQKKRESRMKGLADRRESATFAGSSIRFATPSYNNSSPSKKAPAPSDATLEQIAGASRSSPLLLPSQSSPSIMSPTKDDAHVSKKLKSNNFELNTTLDEAESEAMNGSRSVQPTTVDDASRSSSPLSELEDLEDRLQDDHFLDPTETMVEDRAIPSEIKTRRARPSSKRKTKPKLHAFLPNSSNLAVAPSLSPSSSTFPSNNNTRSHKKSASNVHQKLDPNDAREILRRQARNITLNNGEPFLQSHERAPMRSFELDSESEGAESSIAPSKPSRPRIRLRNGPKVPVNDDSDKSSPTCFPFQVDAMPTSSTNSRQSTPNPYGRPTRKAKSGPRVKTSPMKNRTVPLAGISRASGERNSPVGNGGFGSTQDHDNHDDYCSSCGGGGIIVCCDGDGCRRSYHWLCLDPPRREEDVDPTESIFCSSCTAAMRTATKKTSGLFGTLLRKLERKNPIAFRLEKDISEYFEGVRVGPTGEYEDILPVNHKPKNRAGYEETPDYFRLKDNKGNTIICHLCQRSAASGQPIIDCGFCALHWHLDCLDPPMANPPNKDRPWKCPCHVDDLLEKIPGMLGPAHKYRKIKGAPALRSTGVRDARNNGHIEIENDASDADEQAAGFYNQLSFGKEYRLPERGIKLDFLAKIKQDNMRGAKRKRDEHERDSSLPVSKKIPIAMRSIQEQQAVLNLAQLAGQDSNDKTSELINTLIHNAPDNVVVLMAQGDATNLGNRLLGKQEETSLLALRELASSFIKAIDEMNAAKQVKKAPVRDESENSNGTLPAPEQQTEEAGGTAPAEKQAEEGDTEMS